MPENKVQEKKGKTPNPQEMDRVLAELIGWTANLIGMIRKFPQGQNRDQAVFTSRRILRQLWSLREGDTRPFVRKGPKPEEKKEVVKREKAEKEGRMKEKKGLKPKKLAPKKKAIKKKAPKAKGKPKSEKKIKPKPGKEKKTETKAESKEEEKIIFKKEAPKTASS